MAEQQTSDPRRSGERRQTAPRGSSERRPASYDGGERRPAARDSGERRQAPSRRNDVIRCENCGEDYSITYKRCPFCDERPGRGGVSGKRVANTRGGGYGRPASSLRIAGWVISFAVILCAAFIIIRFMGAPLFGGGRKPNSGSSSTSSSQGSGSSQNPGGSDVSTPVQPSGPSPDTILLSAIEMTLDNGKSTQLTVSLLPEGSVGEVVWASSDPSAATVDSDGLVTNVNAGTSAAQTTITATCGDKTAQCLVTCRPKASTADPSGSTRQGTIVNADTGLNIRSGPGREYDVVASASNGARVTILGEENGWYQVRYNGSLTGYVSKDFVSVG